jgi:pimeloyl-ACP methyl ester carboxylesterase
MVEVILKGRSTARWEEVQGIKCPTLVVRGENSDELPVDEFERMLRENSLIKGLEIAGAGHWVHHDKPIQYISALKDFFGI